MAMLIVQFCYLHWCKHDKHVHVLPFIVVFLLSLACLWVSWHDIHGSIFHIYCIHWLPSVQYNCAPFTTICCTWDAQLGWGSDLINGKLKVKMAKARSNLNATSWSCHIESFNRRILYTCAFWWMVYFNILFTFRYSFLLSFLFGRYPQQD